MGLASFIIARVLGARPTDGAELVLIDNRRGGLPDDSDYRKKYERQNDK